MRGYLFIVAGLCFAVAGGTAECWWLDVWGFTQALVGAVLIELDATREVAGAVNESSPMRRNST